MPASSSTDAHGTSYTIEAQAAVVLRGRPQRLCPLLEVWWSRSFERAAEETLIIKQEYADRDTADVLELSLGQVYDLIDALNKAVENA